MSFLEGYDAGFLLVEINGLFHPSLKGGGDFLHGVDHGGELDV